MAKNRGKEGRDDYLFGTASMQQKMKEAVNDLSFLLERGYGVSSACTLVGNRYALNARQQKALKGMSAAPSAVRNRKQRQRSVQDMIRQRIVIDGFNQLILLESMLSQAYLFRGKDGVYRDLSSVHGTYKRVNQTFGVIELFANFCRTHRIEHALWVFDQPVSNSGRMKTLLSAYARENGLNWEICLEYNPDRFIAKSKDIALTGDAWILDRVDAWYNLTEDILPKNYPFLITCD